ncbi:metal ABC transporter substrate-binding protein [Anaerosporomusa subterranea]|uniref:Lipoprotein n=1 Tax=Anaerosporomusa subterranea TaxID=1794912 RepID=A0A154BLM4_ANASB|nr:MetQ/NlpA family ABC transporter substrate-binding protein [Anaerosporomusa subterranea]KYZ74822.1 metal ABC transporter substrate-binding protein [Anaerosporomusa subterranea]
MTKNYKMITHFLLLTLAFLLLSGCSSNATKPVEQTAIKVGVTAGPHAEIMEVVKKIAEKDGLRIQIIEFSDYMTPNISLNQGEIDANSYQHQPWLDNQIKDRKYELVSIAKTAIFPMGIYSNKVKNINEVRSGTLVAIPNDPTNAGRALALLEKGGLITLKPGVGIKATLTDITSNPKGIKIKELDAAQIPRSLEDVDIAAINTNYAIVAGLVPTKDSLLIEDGNSPFANLLVVRMKDKDKPVFQKLIKAYQSEEVKQYIQEHFKGSAIPAW